MMILILRSLRITFNQRIQLIQPFKLLKKKRKMTQIKEFLTVSSLLQGHKCIRICLQLCQIILESYSDWKLNKVFWKQKQGKEGFRFLKYCRLKRENWKKKQRKWEIGTAGSFSNINLSVIKLVLIAKALCNLNLKFFLIKKKTKLSMKLCCSLLQKYSNLPLKDLIFQNLKKKLTDYSVQMHLILQLVYRMMNKERRNILH